MEELGSKQFGGYTHPIELMEEGEKGARAEMRVFTQKLVEFDSWEWRCQAAEAIRSWRPRMNEVILC